MEDGLEAESRLGDRVNFIRPFGELGIKGLEPARFDVEDSSDILCSDQVEGGVKDELENKVRAKDEAATAAWVRKTAEEAQKKRAISTATSVRKGWLMLVSAAVVFLCALGAVIWEFTNLRLH